MSEYYNAICLFPLEQVEGAVLNGKMPDPLPKKDSLNSLEFAMAIGVWMSNHKGSAKGHEQNISCLFDLLNSTEKMISLQMFLLKDMETLAKHPCMKHHVDQIIKLAC